MARNSRDIELSLAPSLDELGMSCFGWFVMADAPFEGRKAALIGNHAVNGAHKMWDVFETSEEFRDGLANPLDRWTERKLNHLAGSYKFDALFPFGETLWPFQRYAKAATGMQASPLGLLIHPEHGLWQAFRAVLVFGTDVALSVPDSIHHPCEACEDKPCLSACPVSAFSEDGFAVTACRTHLRSDSEPNCMDLGCRARAACPVGVPYTKAQIQFHMKAFGGT